MTISGDTANFLSPSYINDLDRFLLLRRSIRRFATTPVHHVVAVPSSDVHAFETRLRGDPGVTIVAQQDFVSEIFYQPVWAKWLQRGLGPYGWRVKNSRHAGRPGWIIQQIVKLSVPEVFADAPAVIVDSDLVFIRPFGKAELIPEGAGRFLIRAEPEAESAKHREHMRTARQLLALPPASEDHHYMAYPTVWYGDWVRALRAAIERARGKPWQQALFDAGTFSEYLLYGVFVEERLAPNDLQVRTEPLHAGIWQADELATFVLDPKGFLGRAAHNPLSLVIQSNIKVDAIKYSTAIDRILE